MDILNEMNDYAGQRELIAENMMMNICIELTKYLQDLKLERKAVRKRERENWAMLNIKAAVVWKGNAWIIIV